MYLTKIFLFIPNAHFQFYVSSWPNILAHPKHFHFYASTQPTYSCASLTPPFQRIYLTKIFWHLRFYMSTLRIFSMYLLAQNKRTPKQFVISLLCDGPTECLPKPRYQYCVMSTLLSFHLRFVPPFICECQVRGWRVHQRGNPHPRSRGGGNRLPLRCAPGCGQRGCAESSGARSLIGRNSEPGIKALNTIRGRAKVERKATEEDKIVGGCLVWPLESELHRVCCRLGGSRMLARASAGRGCDSGRRGKDGESRFGNRSVGSGPGPDGLIYRWDRVSRECWSGRVMRDWVLLLVIVPSYIFDVGNGRTRSETFLYGNNTRYKNDKDKNWCGARPLDVFLYQQITYVIAIYFLVSYIWSLRFPQPVWKGYHKNVRNWFLKRKKVSVEKSNTSGGDAERSGCAEPVLLGRSL